MGKLSPTFRRFHYTSSIKVPGMADRTLVERSPEVTFNPFTPPSVTNVPEFTFSAVLTGTILGIIFSASSMYLVLKVGMTVSASIPIAVLSISLFRGLSAVLRMRRATILENNMVQTTGSAGESIAFGVGVTMPALMLLGFEMDLYRTMTVAVLGGLLGILMMIPLRRAFIVKQHGKLAYPEGTACADVLTAGEKGGASAAMVFLGFSVAAIVKLLMTPFHIIGDQANWNLFKQAAPGAATTGLHKGVLGGEFTPELLGVGYIIGPRIACVTVSGGVMAYLVLQPTIAMFGEMVPSPIFPSETALIRDLGPSGIRNFYILYIGAGAVATGGIISMGRAMPVILAALVAGLRDLFGGFGRTDKREAAVPRTERDLSMGIVVLGSAVLVFLLALSPKLGLGLSLHGLLGATLVIVFGFLFVTVSSRLTGEIGSSSNPISGMTVATLLLTCLIFLALGKTSKADTLAALTIAGVVCIAASNGGTTAQDLKTGFLVGATPKYQQIGILIGALTSALVIGATVKFVNDAGTHYTKNKDYLPSYVVPPEDLEKLELKQRVGKPYATEDTTLYHVLNVAQGEIPGVPQGKYLVDDQGEIRYREDPAINGLLEYDDIEAEKKARQDRGEPVVAVKRVPFDAPKTKLMALIIDGILNQKLPWSLVLIGALMAISLELCAVPSLPFAVGIYLPLQTSFPIFIGGVMRWIVDKANPPKTEESESSPGVLLCSGYIAGGSIVGVLAAFLNFRDDWVEKLNLAPHLDRIFGRGTSTAQWTTMTAFGLMLALLLIVGIAGRFRGKPAAPVAKGTR
jgi:putative OPT family oligopeptide transporter